MLTWRDLIALCDAGRLARWTQRPGGTVAKGDRVLFMLPEIYEAFQQASWPGSDGEDPRRTASRRTAMRAVLNRYVTGKVLVIRADIKELGTDPKREKMRGLWEFRSQGAIPETRLLGFFARPGAFVALEFDSRGRYEGDGEWVKAKDRCDQAWSRLVGQIPYQNTPWPVTLRSEMMEYLDVTH